MGSVQILLEKTNSSELNEIIGKLSVYCPKELQSMDQDDQEEDEHKNLICLAFRRIRDRWPHSARSDLLKYFSQIRINELSVRSRKIILDAMQQPSIASHPKLEVHIRHILTATSSSDLIRLKLESDSKGNYHSFHKLVYRDITSEDERLLVLKHLHEEAKMIRKSELAHSILGKEGVCPPPRRWLKVISDVDDTFKCSGGHYPAGTDETLPRSCIYPGVSALYRELDRESSQSMISWQPDPLAASPQPSCPPSLLDEAALSVGNLVFLSARPRSYQDWSERGLYRRFASCVADGSLYSMPTALLGDLKAGARFVGAGDSTPLAVGKVKRFREFAKLWPECRYVFIGDNGQGDVRAAEIMSSLGSGRRHVFFSPSFENDVIESLDDEPVLPRQNPPSPLMCPVPMDSPSSPSDVPALSLPRPSTLSPSKSSPSWSPRRSITSTEECYLQVAYINRVIPVGKTFGKGDPVSWHDHHIVFVDTYIDAAIHASSTSYCCRSSMHSVIINTTDRYVRVCGCQLHSAETSALCSPTSQSLSSHSSMIPIEGLRRVCMETIRDFIKLDDPTDPRGWRKGFTGSTLLSFYARELYRLRLSVSIDNANRAFLHSSRITKPLFQVIPSTKIPSLTSPPEPVTPPQSLQIFQIGTRVAIRRPTQVKHFLKSGSKLKRDIIPPVFGSGRGGPGEYGCDGVVVNFRPEDGVYVVDLIRWKLSDGKYVKGYFMIDQLAPISSEKKSSNSGGTADEILINTSPREDSKSRTQRAAEQGDDEDEELEEGSLQHATDRMKLEKQQSFSGDGSVPSSWSGARFGFFRGDGSEHRSLRRRFKSKLKTFKNSFLSSNLKSDEEDEFDGTLEPLMVV